MTLATSNFLVPNGTFIVVLLAFIVVVGVIGKKVLPVAQQGADRAPGADPGRARGGRQGQGRRRGGRHRAAGRCSSRPGPRPARSCPRRRPPPTRPSVRAEADAQAIHDRIVQSADAEVVIARQAAVEEVTARVGEIVLAAAERVIGREIQAADHQDLIDEAIAAVRCRDRRCRRRPPEPAGEPSPPGLSGRHGGVAGRRRRRWPRPAPSWPPWPSWSTAAPSSRWPSTTGRCRWRPAGRVLDHLLEGKVRPEVRQPRPPGGHRGAGRRARRLVPLAGCRAWPSRRPGRDRRRRRDRGRGGARSDSARATGSRATPPPCSRR